MILRPKKGRWQVSIEPDRNRSAAEAAPLVTATVIQCVIGDFEESREANLSSPRANSTIVTLDLENSIATIATGLTGLPPVFAFREFDQVHFSSPFIPEAARGVLRPDVDGIADTLRWGHPIDGRTLFADLSLIPAASTVTVNEHGQASISRNAGDLESDDLTSLTTDELIEEQLHAFDKSAARIRSDKAFVSLSGGLDSRTSLVGLIKHGRSVPCVTVSGKDVNLDVRLAKAFCTAHGLQHHVVMLGDDFLRQLPDLALQTAALTGGVSCLSQTADLYLYAALGCAFQVRISGNLGNQVGRGGVESLSAYDPTPAVFSPEVRERLAGKPKAPWFVERLAAGDYGGVLFGQEVHYWSTANYVVGSSRALQLTPYANARLLQLSRAVLARSAELKQPTVKSLRARDLRHRFAGTPRPLSFQRRYLIEHDVRGRNIPLNWGWYASGGWSPKWVLTATVSASDAALIKLSRSPSPAGVVAKWIAPKVRHPSTLVDWARTLKKELRALATETFNSRPVREAGIFDLKVLQEISEEHFAGANDHHHTVFQCLQIALGMFARASHHSESPYTDLNGTKK